MTIKTLVISAVSAIALTSFAQAGEGNKSKGAKSEERKAKMLERFDTDGDGVLSDTEKEAAKAARAAKGKKKSKGSNNNKAEETENL